MTSSESAEGEWTVWWRWVVASIVGAGLGTACGAVVAFFMGMAARFGSEEFFLLLLCVGAGVVGSVCGMFQELALRQFIRFVGDYDVGGWGFASGVGAALGVFAVYILFTGDRPWWQLQDLLHATEYSGVAVIIAVCLGTTQWWVLRHVASGVGWWVAWNIAAALLSSLVPRITIHPLWLITLIIAIYAIVTGCGILWLRFQVTQRDAAANERAFNHEPATVYGWLGALTFLLFVLTCGASGLFIPTDTIPSYPRAENLVVTPADEDDMFKDEYTRFTTVDAPKDVLLFYRKRLANRGWHYQTSIVHPTQGWHSLTFSTPGCGGPSVVITATLELDNRTSVTLETSSYPCY